MSRDLYKACQHIARTRPDRNPDPEILDHITYDFRVLPSFEKTLMEHKYIRHYSLKNNELLKCRWDQYRGNAENIVVQPFIFPNARDLHFYNNTVQYLPELSTFRKTDVRFKVKAGPLIDKFGAVPIPDNLLMKRGTAQKENMPENNKNNIDKKERTHVKKNLKVVKEDSNIFSNKKDKNKVKINAQDGKKRNKGDNILI